MKTLQRGLWAGIIATGPMTLAMFLLFRRLPTREKSPLPPATISSEIQDGILGKAGLAAQGLTDLAMISHFAYGAVCGALFASLRRSEEDSSLRAAGRGAAFGAGVWAFNYLGMLPAFNFRASAYKMPARRNAMMLFSHLIWGLSLGLAELHMHQSGNRMLQGHGKAFAAE
jgi:uncharacterized membrane protein YagU involved in acid resistance